MAGTLSTGLQVFLFFTLLFLFVFSVMVVLHILACRHRLRSRVFTVSFPARGLAVDLEKDIESPHSHHGAKGAQTWLSAVSAPFTVFLRWRHRYLYQSDPIPELSVLPWYRQKESAIRRFFCFVLGKRSIQRDPPTLRSVLKSMKETETKVVFTTQAHQAHQVILKIVVDDLDVVSSSLWPRSASPTTQSPIAASSAVVLFPAASDYLGVPMPAQTGLREETPWVPNVSHVSGGTSVLVPPPQLIRAPESLDDTAGPIVTQSVSETNATAEKEPVIVAVVQSENTSRSPCALLSGSASTASCLVDLLLDAIGGESESGSEHTSCADPDTSSILSSVRDTPDQPPESDDALREDDLGFEEDESAALSHVYDSYFEGEEDEEAHVYFSPKSEDL